MCMLFWPPDSIKLHYSSVLGGKVGRCGGGVRVAGVPRDGVEGPSQRLGLMHAGGAVKDRLLIVIVIGTPPPRISYGLV